MQPEVDSGRPFSLHTARAVVARQTYTLTRDPNEVHRECVQPANRFCDFLMAQYWCRNIPAELFKDRLDALRFSPCLGQEPLPRFVTKQRRSHGLHAKPIRRPIQARPDASNAPLRHHPTLELIEAGNTRSRRQQGGVFELARGTMEGEILDQSAVTHRKELREWTAT